MADFAGLAIGIVNLVDSCVTASKMFSTAKHFSTEAETLRLGLIREEGRLKSWARSWGIPIEAAANSLYAKEAVATKLLIDEAEDACIDLEDIEATLKNMWELLSQGKAIQEAQLGPSHTSNSIKNFFDTQFGPLTSRIQWIVNDKDRLRSLIADLKDHNDGLDRIRPQNVPYSLRSRNAAVACEVVATVDDLALTLSEDGSKDQQWDESNSVEIERWESKISRVEQAPFKKRPLAYYQADRNSSSLKVMIEWKYYSNYNLISKSLALSRAERVAQLLSFGAKSPDLRILDCVGYFQDDIHSRCGLVYELPRNVATGEHHEPGLPQVVSLGEVLQSRARPTLADRFHLARILAISMLEFHLANWLHKNFNADNVIFFLPAGAEVKDTNIRSPFIGSFGLARPDQQFVESEVISSTNVNIDFAYMHPAYHYPTTIHGGDGSLVPRFHRSFDVYSLGCILLEIGLWKPLKSLGWEDRYEKDLDKWRRFLQGCVQKNLTLIAGPIYAEVVMKCLESDVMNGDTRGESERVRLLLGYCAKIGEFKGLVVSIQSRCKTEE
ncbi:hypothetical protein CPB86DRAFT_825504 [Serendipita vermifera]|nr:hypothetical protein CPB86DRAFT_825504 [Serendipita vermifera]